MEKRSCTGDTSAFLIVATVSSPRSTSIVSRTRAFFSCTLYSSLPDGSSNTSVSRTRSALPSTFTTRCPAPFSIQ